MAGICPRKLIDQWLMDRWLLPGGFLLWAIDWIPFRTYLIRKGIARSRTTPHKPTESSLCEKFSDIKGTIPPKNDKVFINSYFFASNEVSTCSGCWCVILQLCDVCIHQYLRNVCRKFVILKSLNFETSKEQILVSKEADFRHLQSYREFFFSIFEFWKKITPSGMSGL